MAQLIYITLPALQAGKMKFSATQLSRQYTSQAPILPGMMNRENVTPE
jgi:hypothetical protein